MERKNQKLSALITTLLLCSAAQAQTTVYTDAWGRTLGSATQSGSTVFYNGPMGQPLGSATQSGNSVFFSNANGQVTGAATAIDTPVSPLWPNTITGQPFAPITVPSWGKTR